MLSVDEIKALCTPQRVHKVVIDSWGGEVCLRRWTLPERYEWAQYSKQLRDATEDQYAWCFALIARCLCNEQGELIFNDEFANTLAQCEGRAMDELFSECCKLNIATPEKLIEIAKKNLATPS